MLNQTNTIASQPIPSVHMRDFPDLFAEYDLGRLRLRNRIVMAPMGRNRAGEGNVPTELNATYYQQRASAGLIITEGSQVSAQGAGYPNTPATLMRLPAAPPPLQSA